MTTGPSPRPSIGPPTTSGDSGRKSLRVPIAIVAAFVFVIATAGAAYVFVFNTTEKRYLKALNDAGLSSQFSADRAAVQNAQDVCTKFDHGAKPQGSAADQVGVTYYCPDYAAKFHVLETIDVDGTFEILSTSSLGIKTTGSYCEGSGGYGDLNASTAVVVKNTKGDELTRTELGEGAADTRSGCKFTFHFTVREGEDKYILSISHRGDQSYSFEDLKQPGRIALTIGP